MSDVLETAAPPIDAGAEPAQNTIDTQTNAAAPQTEEDHANAALDAHDVIKTHVIAAMAVGLMPVPGVDMAGTIALQVRMVSKICEIYGVTIREKAAKTAVLSLVGGVLPVGAGAALAVPRARFNAQSARATSAATFTATGASYSETFALRSDRVAVFRAVPADAP